MAVAGSLRGRRTLLVAAAVATAAVPASPAAVHSPSGPPPVVEAPAALVEAPTSVAAVLPAAAFRVPVLLVPGWGHGEADLAALRGRLLGAGWEDALVLPVSFADPVGSNRDHAREIAQAALELKLATGADRIDVVAHSMGGLATRYFLQNGGDGHVRRVVFLATPHHGTIAAFFAWGDGAREMQPGSTFLWGLRRADPIPPGVRAINIRTPLDLHVLPPESATLPGTAEVKVCCPTHAGLLDDEGTFEAIERFLRDVG